jgi:hypothetical protein
MLVHAAQTIAGFLYSSLMAGGNLRSVTTLNHAWR